jgi:hypothetical protein
MPVRAGRPGFTPPRGPAPARADLPPDTWARALTVHHILSPTDRLTVAACEQVGCLKYRRGWDMTFDPATADGARACAMVRSGQHGRTYRELPRVGEGLVVFRFASGQRCFTEHKTRPELFVVQNAAGMELGARRRERPRFWHESLHETYERRLAAKQRG